MQRGHEQNNLHAREEPETHARGSNFPLRGRGPLCIYSIAPRNKHSSSSHLEENTVELELFCPKTQPNREGVEGYLLLMQYLQVHDIVLIYPRETPNPHGSMIPSGASDIGSPGFHS